MDKLLQNIQNRLMTEVPELVYIDEDWGQLDYYDAHPPVKFPCALIDIQGGQFSDDGELRQRGVITIAVKLYLFKLSNTSGRAPQEQKDKAKKGWQICEKVNRTLHGQNFLSEGFAAPIRQSMQRVKRPDGLYERDVVYTVGVVDESCVPVRKMAKAGAKIRAAIHTI